MPILRLQHVGLAVRDLKEACERFETLFGLTARDYRNDQGRGMHLDARILFGNGCWLHLVQNWNPEARVNQFFLTNMDPGWNISLSRPTVLKKMWRICGNWVCRFLVTKFFVRPTGSRRLSIPTKLWP